MFKWISNYFKTKKLMKELDEARVIADSMAEKHKGHEPKKDKLKELVQTALKTELAGYIFYNKDDNTFTFTKENDYGFKNLKVIVEENSLQLFKEQVVDVNNRWVMEKNFFKTVSIG